jgi:hypothetical protein
MTRSLSRLSVLLLLAAGGGQACTIPVFRYALDRWPAGKFTLLVPDSWKEGEAGKKLAELMRESSPNLVVAAPGDEAAGEALLWSDFQKTAWSGTPDAATLQGMVSSPVRTELARRILAGDTAVWVLVESGDAGKDEAFAKQLAARLNYLGSVAAIPPQDPNDPDSQLGPGPELKVGFSLLRIKRDDPKEQFTVRFLAGPEGRALAEGGACFAAPVFGRGRVLGAWKPDDLDDAGIDEVSLFLLGACSCRVKNLNPGWDLLMDVDWESGLTFAEMARRRAGDNEQPDAP